MQRSASLSPASKRGFRNLCARCVVGCCRSAPVQPRSVAFAVAVAVAIVLTGQGMPIPSTVKKGRVIRVTRVHEERDIVRVDRDNNDGSGPSTEVLDHRQTRSSITPDKRNKGKTAAALPSSVPLDVATGSGPSSDVPDSQRAAELLAQAEKLLRQPIQGGTRQVTTAHDNQAGPSRQLELGSSVDAVPDTQYEIEEVHPDTAEDGEQDEPQVEEPESSIAAPSGRSASMESVENTAATKGDAISKAQSPDKVNKQT